MAGAALPRRRHAHSPGRPADWWLPFDGLDVAPGRPPLAITGWRFQASTADGETHVFDVGHDGRHWQVLRVFD
ncbi:hypothetical protein [Agromyces flavus]|uniref:hypothetical protein n=1 Tax=Agromyces flavus TaxID=589382 RepID=UPI0036180FBB